MRLFQLKPEFNAFVKKHVIGNCAVIMIMMIQVDHIMVMSATKKNDYFVTQKIDTCFRCTYKGDGHLCRGVTVAFVGKHHCSLKIHVESLLFEYDRTEEISVDRPTGIHSLENTVKWRKRMKLFNYIHKEFRLFRDVCNELLST